MSAFMLSNKLLSKIAVEVMKAVPTMFGVHIEESPAYPSGSAGGLAKSLYDMNRRALKARYADRYDFAPFEFDNSDIYPWTKIRLYKALRCYLYQCSEGSVPGSKFFRLVEAASQIVADRIVSGLPEYESLPWGE
jgi:hypothetical protein